MQQKVYSCEPDLTDDGYLRLPACENVEYLCNIAFSIDGLPLKNHREVKCASLDENNG